MQRLVEQPADIGDVFEGGTRLGQVHYHLSIYQQFPVLKNHAGAGESGTGEHESGRAEDEVGLGAFLPSYDVEGRISPLSPLDLGDLHRRHVELTLRMADGRVLDFWVADDEGTIRSTGRGLHE